MWISWVQIPMLESEVLSMMYNGDDKRGDDLGNPELGKRQKDHVFNLKQEHKFLKQAVEDLGEKLSSMASRQDNNDKVVTEILTTLKSNGKVEEQTRDQAKAMSDSIRELTILFGDIKVALVQSSLVQTTAVDEKLSKVYDNIKLNTSLVNDVKESINQHIADTKDEVMDVIKSNNDNIINNYPTTAGIKNQLLVGYALATVILLLTGYIYNKHVVDSERFHTTLSQDYSEKVKHVFSTIKEKSGNHSKKLNRLEDKISMHMHSNINHISNKDEQ